MSQDCGGSSTSCKRRRNKTIKEEIRSVSNVAETIFLATRIGNDFLYGSIEAIGRAFDRVKQYTEELSRINVHNAETIKVLG
jgi:hypothetical protein